MKPQLMTVPEVAVVLHVSEKTAWNLLRSGRLPRIKVGGCTRVPASAVAALVGQSHVE